MANIGSDNVDTCEAVKGIIQLIFILFYTLLYSFILFYIVHGGAYIWLIFHGIDLVTSKYLFGGVTFVVLTGLPPLLMFL